MPDLIERDVAIKLIQPRVKPKTVYGEGYLNAIEHVAELLTLMPSANCWISCSERLPEQDGEYLVFTEYKDVFKCTFDSTEENKCGFKQDHHDPDTLGWAGSTWTAVETVTHWMPLPEPPKGE